jgi:hypothetical protein
LELVVGEALDPIADLTRACDANGALYLHGHFTRGRETRVGVRR